LRDRDGEIEELQKRVELARKYENLLGHGAWQDLCARLDLFIRAQEMVAPKDGVQAAWTLGRIREARNVLERPEMTIKAGKEAMDRLDEILKQEG